MGKKTRVLHCKICGCRLNYVKDTYAKPTLLGRSHGTRHHYIAERFFGRTTNKRSNIPNPIFKDIHFQDCANRTETFCYECHEELLHNPILLPADIEKFSTLVKKRGCGESDEEKTKDREKIAKRIQLLNEVISAGLDKLLKGK